MSLRASREAAKKRSPLYSVGTQPNEDKAPEGAEEPTRKARRPRSRAQSRRSKVVREGRTPKDER
jgi:hypothetical protein